MWMAPMNLQFHKMLRCKCKWNDSCSVFCWRGEGCFKTGQCKSIFSAKMGAKKLQKCADIVYGYSIVGKIQDPCKNGGQETAKMGWHSLWILHFRKDSRLLQKVSNNIKIFVWPNASINQMPSRPKATQGSSKMQAKTLGTSFFAPLCKYVHLAHCCC